MRAWKIIRAALLAGISLSAPAKAAPFIADGACAVVVASRSSIEEARSYIFGNDLGAEARIYRSRNGWYAISSQIITLTGSSEAISRMKQTGQIPADAYCSTGASYIEEIDWLGIGTTPQSDRRPADGLRSDFDARPLTRGERRFLQAALAMNGYYAGLLDGVWGNGSQSALTRYTIEQFDDAPSNFHVAYLTLQTVMRWKEEGWRPTPLPRYGVSIMLPIGEMDVIEKADGLRNFEHRSKPLTVTVQNLPPSSLVEIHRLVAGTHGITGEPYFLRREGRWVTSITTSNSTIYVRSDLIAGSWSTVSVFAEKSLAGEVGLITSSIAAGEPQQILPDAGGVLLGHAKEMGELIRENVTEESTPDVGTVGAAPPKPGRRSISGTAFFITDDGVALTNAHVVDRCEGVTLGSKPAQIIASSTTFDLAALRLTTPEEVTPLLFSPRDAGLNADITIAGYPLQGILGVCQTSCPPNSCGVSDFRGADFVFGVEPDGPGRLPVAGFT